MNSPLGCQPKGSRFSDGTFAVLYAAAVPETAILETVIRDQFAQLSRRRLGFSEVSNRARVQMHTKVGCTLKLLDLRGSGCTELGAPTDAVHSRNTSAGQALGRSIYRHYSHIDGFLYPSRFAGTDNYAVFDRALDKLEVMDAGVLTDLPMVAQVLKRHDIQLLEHE